MQDGWAWLLPSEALFLPGKQASASAGAKAGIRLQSGAEFLPAEAGSPRGLRGGAGLQTLRKGAGAEVAPSLAGCAGTGKPALRRFAVCSPPAP